MKILIMSDVHANHAALTAVVEDAGVGNKFDHVWCLGDIVNYGPQPKECLEVVRAISDRTIRGNHDNAVGLGVDCGCSIKYQALADASKEFTRAVLGEEDKGFLAALPLVDGFEINGQKFLLSHGSPSGDMYMYLKPSVSGSTLLGELEGVNADFVFLGHTHQPMIVKRRKLGNTTIINPGSVGQPRDGSPLASYALWEDGQVEIKRVEYDLDKTLTSLRDTGLKDTDADLLSKILREGGL
ncbi:MAG: metallophosphoesterase family protein [Candidatus Brocadiales bacterium]